MMTMPESANLLPIGAIVKIRNSGYPRAKIVAYVGPFGPKGANVYRLRVRGKPIPAYIEVLEEQIELIPTGK